MSRSELPGHYIRKADLTHQKKRTQQLRGNTFSKRRNHLWRLVWQATNSLIAMPTEQQQPPQWKHDPKEYVEFEGFESQWLRARLCCRKISDSIFWLHCFTPRWLAGTMPCPRKSQKKYTKRKDRNRWETKTFLLYFPLFTGWRD